MKEKSLSVLFVTGIFYPDVGGPAIHVRRFAEYLNQKGHTVRVITYTQNKEKDTFSFPVTRIAYGPKLMRWFLFFITVLLYTPFYKVVYVHDLTAAGVPGVISAKLFRKKVLLRNVGDQLWERAAESGKTKLSFLEYYEAKNYKKDYPSAARLVQFVLQNLNTYITASTLLKDVHTKHFGISDNKVVVLPNPMEQKKHEAREDREIHEPFPTFIFGGRFIPYKNLLLTIQAFALCFEKHKKGKVLLIGKGPEREKLEKEIQKRGLQKNIEIVSSVSHEKLAEYIRNAHVGLAPALTEFNPKFTSSPLLNAMTSRKLENP
jgi:glycosyltransferase involved in cell wall biosynthesis